LGAPWPVASLWILTGSGIAGYVLLFLLARSRVSLRPGLVARLLGVAVVARTVLLGCGYPLQSILDLVLTGSMVLTAGLLLLVRRAWLVRVTVEELREQLQTASRGLFLEVREPQPGRWVLVSKGEHELRLVGLTRRLQVLLLCPPPDAGKVPLLLSWLSRQYPGPMPRIRIVLKGGSP